MEKIKVESSQFDENYSESQHLNHGIEGIIADESLMEILLPSSST